jgi:histidinol-phosphate aminotransferase
MAGVRLGYGLMAREVAQKLRPWQLDNDINATAAVVGSVALDDTKAMEAAARRIVSDREQFLRQAQARNIKVVPTLTNFAMLHTGRPAPQVIQDFRSRNIQIGRTFPSMMDYVRISFGTPEQMQTFWSAWDQIGGARAA